MELRPVKVLMKKASNRIDGSNTQEVPAQYADGFFHCWEHHKSEDFSCVYAVIELEDSGKVIKKEPEDVRFKTDAEIQNEAISGYLGNN